MIDKKSEYLELPLPNEQNMLEDDCPRIVEAFRKVDAHAKTADERLDGVEGRADSLEIRASALETAQASTEGTLQSHAASLSSLATEKADATALAGEVQARTEAVSGEASGAGRCHHGSRGRRDAGAGGSHDRPRRQPFGA